MSAVVLQVLYSGVEREDLDGKKIQNGCTMDIQNSQNPLYLASQEGFEGIVQQLLTAGFDVNAPSLYNITPIYIASYEVF